MDIVLLVFCNFISELADITGILGFVLAVFTIIMQYRLSSQLRTLRSAHLFDKRINKHITNLSGFARSINDSFNEYDKNLSEIKKIIGLCTVELSDLLDKLGTPDAKKCRRVLDNFESKKKQLFLTREKESEFRASWYKGITIGFYTTYEDVWNLHYGLHEVILQMNNIKENRKKSLPNN